MSRQDQPRQDQPPHDQSPHDQSPHDQAATSAEAAASALQLVSAEALDPGAGVEIVSVDPVDGYGLRVGFTDGTVARYAVEELLDLRPYRERPSAAGFPG